MAEFFWTGSTAASSDSFRFDVLANWKQISNATAGRTLAIWTNATRLPQGMDKVWVGSPDRGQKSSYWPGPYIVWSPILYGGFTGGTGPKVWSGVTAGTARLNKHGFVVCNIEPSYPFSQVGGELNIKLLNEWAEMRNKWWIETKGATFPIGFNTTALANLIYTANPFDNTLLGFGLTGATGTFELSGSTADGDESAVYTVRPGLSYGIVDGISKWFMSGAGTTLSFSKPATFFGENSIRWMGPVLDRLSIGKAAYFRGFTAGITISQGATTAYDGSNNSYMFEGYSVQTTLGITGSDYNETNRGNIEGFKTPYSKGYYTVYPPETYQAPRKGDAFVCGVWAEIGSRQFGSREGNLVMIGVTANRVALVPQYTPSYVRTSSPGAGWSGYLYFILNGASGGTYSSPAHYDMVLFDELSNAKTFVISDNKNGMIGSIGNAVIRGDLTSTSGFNCLSQPYGGLTGASAAAGTSVTTLGNLVLNPCIFGCTLDLGYQSSLSDQKASTTVTIGNIYNFASAAKEWSIRARGRLGVTNTSLYGGAFIVDSTINDDDAISLTNLVLDGDSVLDLSQAPNHRGVLTTIDFNSNTARIIPSTNTLLTTNFKSIVAKNNLDTFAVLIAAAQAQ